MAAVPGAQGALDRLKMEVASGVGVNLKSGYNGDLTSREAGLVGGNITKRLVQMAEQSLSGK
jgi:hypothetical protein